jgi:acyl transferase domain-containing protein
VKGDPLEAEAIARVFGKNRSPSNPVIVGSIKTNVGHLEGASGLAGLIKTVLILETGLIPPNLNFEQPNERIPLQQWNLKVSVF